MLICPSFFDGRLDGIGRVSGALAEVMTAADGRAPTIWSANDPASAAPPAAGRAFGKNYRRMMWAAGTSSLRDAAVSPVIVCTHLGLGPVARLLARRARRPYTVFLHGIECWKTLRARARWGLQGAAFLLANSQHTAASFRAHNPWARGRAIRVVPLGVSVETLEATPSVPAARAESTLRVLAVGRMVKSEQHADGRGAADLYKGFKPLIEAINQVQARGVRVTAELVGDGDARAELEAWVRQQPGREQIRFRGRVSDAELQQCYRDADVFALPSEGEGFGLVFAEAMAHGLPCLCVELGAAPEVVSDDDSGFVARARDQADLADKLLVLAGNARLRERLARGARSRYAAQFSHAQFFARLRAALQPEATT